MKFKKLPSTYYDVISTNDPLKLKQKCFVQQKPNTTKKEKIINLLRMEKMNKLHELTQFNTHTTVDEQFEKPGENAISGRNEQFDFEECSFILFFLLTSFWFPKSFNI